MALTQDQQKQIFLVAVVVVVFPFFWWKMLMTPALDSIKAKRDDNQKIEGEVDTMKRTAARLGALEKERDALAAEVGKAEKKLPRSKNLEEIIRIVTEQAQRQKIFIATFSPEAERPQNYYVEIPFGISFTANIHSLARFLSAMGQQERIMAAKNLTMSFSLNAKRGHTVTGSFSLIAYIFKG